MIAPDAVTDTDDRRAATSLAWLRALSAAVCLVCVGALVACGDTADEGGADVASVEEEGPAPQARDDVNVLVLSVDTLRADRLGCYGNDMWGLSPSPVIDALATRGVTFDRSTVPRGQTRPSIAALFSGKYPITTGLRENALMLRQRHRTFVQRLQAGGHRTGVFMANFSKAGIGANWAYRGADVAVQGQDAVRMQQVKDELTRDKLPIDLLESRLQVEWDDRVERGALDFLDAQSPDEPFTAYVHFYDVHKPYNPPEGYDLYGHGDDVPVALTDGGADAGHRIHEHLDAITLSRRDVPEPELRRIFGLYDGTVTATDARIGRLLAKLDEIGVADNTIVVFTSDHGEELCDRNSYFYHGNSIYDGVLRVPLIIAGPGLDGGERVDVPVQNIAVTATIFELTGLPIPGDCEGVSLVGTMTGVGNARPREMAYFEWQDVVYAVSDGRHTYVHNPKGAHLRKPPYFGTEYGYAIDCFEAYDLRSDPRQGLNLLANKDARLLHDPDNLPAPIGDLRRALDGWLDEPEHEKVMSRPGMGPEHAKQMAQEVQMLYALGYVGVTHHDRVYLGGCEEK